MAVIEMIHKAWTFALEDGQHTVELEFSLWSARERLHVDGQLLSDELRWVIRSEYRFPIGAHTCILILMPSIQCVLRIDEQPVELLPSEVLLRPSQATASEGSSSTGCSSI